MRKLESLAPVALVCIIALFTLFAVGSQPKPFLIGGLAQYILPALLTMYLLVLLYHSRVIVDALASFLLGNRKREGGGGSTWTVIIGYAVAVILGLLLIRSSAIRNMLGSFEAVISSASAGNHLAAVQATGPAPNPYFFYYAVLVFLGIAIVSFSLLIGAIHRAYHWTREEHTPVSMEVARLDALRVVQDATKGLRATGDYRETIVNCYRDMCHVLSLRGMKIGPDETAGEFSKIISEKLRIGARSVSSLTSLFEEARYSNHLMNDAKRAEAIEELERLERTLTNAEASAG